MGKEGTGKVLDELSMASILEMSEGSDSRRCIKSLLEKVMKSDPSDAKRALGTTNNSSLELWISLKVVQIMLCLLSALSFYFHP